MTDSPSKTPSAPAPADPFNRQETLTADTFLRGLWQENPVFVMLLGMCPVLAVTNSAINAIGMGLATTFVLLGSGALVSLLRHWIPKQVRIASYIVIIATFVTVVDYAIHAISLELYASLGAFIQLIVVNCIILGRAEAYASKQRLLPTLVNGLGMGLGFTLALLSLGSVREILGNGTLLGYPLFGEGFQPWLVMVLPPGGFFVLGAWLLLFAWLKQRRERRILEQAGVAAHG
ncbi:MAG TPA: electron transport complex subunit E [Chromatiaceae bacterium]|nr:electron transport complex subunit E [Chromatiaceae bacterium]